MMKSALALTVLCRIAHADDGPIQVPTDAPPVTAPPAAPAPVDAPVRPEDQNVDHTAFQASGPPTAVTAATPPPEVAPVLITGSGYVAGFGYSGHPTRNVGMESQVRGDVWRGLDWGVHFSYTLDVISADDAMTGTYSATTFHDFNLGTSLGLGLAVPSWAFVELHGLDGSTVYGSGMGAMLGGGIRPSEKLGLDLEVGLGTVWTSGDLGFTGTLRAAHKHVGVPWLDLAATLIYTHDAPDNMVITTGGSHVAGDLEASMGPFGRARIVLDVTEGDRVFALLDRGQMIENVPDVQHLRLRGFLWVDITKHLRGYLGASYRSATAPIATGGKDYSLASAFTGAVYNF